MAGCFSKDTITNGDVKQEKKTTAAPAKQPSDMNTQMPTHDEKDEYSYYAESEEEMEPKVFKTAAQRKAEYDGDYTQEEDEDEEEEKEHHGEDSEDASKIEEDEEHKKADGDIEVDCK